MKLGIRMVKIKISFGTNYCLGNVDRDETINRSYIFLKQKVRAKQLKITAFANINSYIDYC